MAHGCSVGKSQSTYKMCWQWKTVQAHILKYKHLQYFILFVSMASNYIQVWREQWTYVCDAQLLCTDKEACLSKYWQDNSYSGVGVGFSSFPTSAGNFMSVCWVLPTATGLVLAGTPLLLLLGLALLLSGILFSLLTRALPSDLPSEPFSSFKFAPVNQIEHFIRPILIHKIN